MRRRTTEAQRRRLTGWADDYTTKSERRVLGDDAAAILAQERKRQQQRRRRPFVLDLEEDVSPTRPATQEGRSDESCREIMAQREQVLSGRPGLPWRADQ